MIASFLSEGIRIVYTFRLRGMQNFPPRRRPTARRGWAARLGGVADGMRQGGWILRHPRGRPPSGSLGRFRTLVHYTRTFSPCQPRLTGVKLGRLHKFRRVSAANGAARTAANGGRRRPSDGADFLAVWRETPENGYNFVAFSRKCCHLFPNMEIKSRFFQNRDFFVQPTKKTTDGRGLPPVFGRGEPPFLRLFSLFIRIKLKNPAKICRIAEITNFKTG